MQWLHRQKEVLQTSVFWSRVTVLLAATLIIAAFICIKDYNFFGDEGFHRSQIERFMRHDWGVNGDFTTIPGFHAIMAAISVFTGETSLQAMRFVGVLFSIGGMIMTLCAARKLHPGRGELRMLQVLLLPILFPFFPLLYTDATALTFVLASVLAFVYRKYGLSLFLIALSVIIRQNNIVWFGCFTIAWLLTEYTPELHAAWFATIHLRWSDVVSSVKKITRSTKTKLTFLFVILCTLAFGIFVKINGGIAIGDQGSHPFPDVHTGNVFFMLALYSIFFLPMIVWQLPTIYRNLKEKKWLVPLIVGLFIFYMLTFWNTHGYNQDIHSVFLRNRILVLFTLTPAWKAVGFIAVVLAVLSLVATPLLSPWWLIYPMAVAYLIPSWLIEQRYFFVPMVLFILFRKAQPMWMEWTLVIYEAIFAGYLFWIVATRWLFL
jgi:alpha-1,2-glucosyltransferase